MKYETPENVAAQDRAGRYLAKALGCSWEPNHEEFSPCDGYLHREGCVAAVEFKMRESRHPTYTVDKDKIERLIQHANECRVLPVYLLKVEGKLLMRAVRQDDPEQFPSKEQTHNERGTTRLVIVYPWSSFQEVASG